MTRKQGSYLTQTELNEIKRIQAIQEIKKIKERNINLPTVLEFPEFLEFLEFPELNYKRMKSLNYLNLNQKRIDPRIRHKVVFIKQGNNIKIVRDSPNGTLNTRLGHIKLT